MSQIKVDTITDELGTGAPDFPNGMSADSISDGTTSVGTSYVVNGSAKAWVNFNGAGTVAIRDSFNLSSLTDVDTGNYTVNFTNAFANTNFVSQGSASTASTNPNGIWTSGMGIATASSRKVITHNTNGNYIDAEFAQGCFLGNSS